MKKLTVLIADDDKLVLKDLKTMVNWGQLGFSICGMVPSGEEALAYMENHPVDLFITDIKMMGLNGLDVIEAAHDKYPAMKFLVISSYNEFDYAKRAIANGVLDYLLKTEITPATLTQKLLEVQQSFSSEYQSNSAVIEQELETFFTSNTQESYEHYPHLNSYGNKKYYFSMVYLCAVFTRDVQQMVNSFRAQMNHYKKDIYQTALDYCATPLICSYNEALILGFSDEIPNSQVHATLHKFGSLLAYRLNNSSSPCIQFYTYQKMTITEFRAFIQPIVPLILHHLLFYKDMLINLDELIKLHYIPVTHHFPFHSLVFDEDYQESNILLLKSYIEECCRSYDSYALVTFFQHFCSHLELTSNNQMQLPRTLHSHTMEHFQKWIYNTLNECIQLVTRGLEYKYSPVVDQAIHFMQQNYSEFDLSSTDIADHVGLSSNRLGVLFKKDTGKTVNEYLSMIRVDKAIELLEKTNMKIYAISEKCGYKSSQYFSQIIFQKTGKRPIDFRKASR